MSRFTPLIVLSLALTGCGQPAEPPAANNSATAAADDDYLARIAALNPAQQQLVLFRAIRDAGQDCQDIRNTERLADDATGRAVWRVTCRGGGQWAVSIGRDGVANVTGPTTPRR